MPKKDLSAGPGKTRHSKNYTCFNIIALTLGMALVILAFVWVRSVFRFDNCHVHRKEIFRIIEKKLTPGGQAEYLWTHPAPLASLLKTEIPELKNLARVWMNKWSVERPGKTLVLKGAAVDPVFLEMFTFPLAAGNPRYALSESPSMVITEDAAEKLFGNENPMGRPIRLAGSVDLKVTGILKHIPAGSHLTFDFLVSFSIAPRIGADLSNWETCCYWMYAWIPGQESAEMLNKKIQAVLARHPEFLLVAQILLQPLSEIPLYELRSGGFIT